MKPARLLVFQSPRNPTERDREILTLLVEGHTTSQAAGHLGLETRCSTSALEPMRHRYTTPTNAALIALAIRLQSPSRSNAPTAKNSVLKTKATRVT